jgi:phosphoglycerate dehydrogenase-like enzyme
MASKKSRPRVLVCDPIAQVGIDLMKEHFDVDMKLNLTNKDLIKIVSDYDAVVVRSSTKITAEVIEHASQLKVVGRPGAGLGNIDVGTAKSKGIAVVNSPDANTVAVAEHTLALILALARHLPRANQGLKKGKWEKKELTGRSLEGKTLGIVGFGRIGREVAIRAQAFGMKVLVNQLGLKPEDITDMGVEAMSLDKLLKSADFVTLHIPKKKETKNLINAQRLALMKPYAYLINTSQGTVVDESALLDALNNKQIAGAGLDVFVEEPAGDNLLARHNKVIATPHIGASTLHAQQSAATTIAQKIIDVILKPKIDNPLSLKVVALEDVFPHENIDPHRVERLAKKLKSATVFTNPPIVVESNGNYIVLDGATRTTAFEKLKFPHIIVQVIAEDSHVILDTWLHVIRQIDPSKLIKMLDNLPEISMVESETDKVLEEMVDYGGLCYLHTIDDKVYHIKPAPAVNHLDALNKLTNTYIEASYVTRVVSSDMKMLSTKYMDLAALVIFPKYEIDQVLQIARSGRRLPAGITRFIIPGRVMRLNADLNFLRSDKSLREKNEWLYHLTMDKLAKDQVRYYEEPVYLMDE